MTRLRRHAIPLLASIGAALLVGGLFGCAGVVAVVRGSTDFRVEQPTLPSHQVLSTYHRGLPATAERALRAFGEPDEIIDLGRDRERWRYRIGLRLHGVSLLLIVVPLPLLVPTGVHQAYVELEKGIVVQVHGSQNADVATDRLHDRPDRGDIWRGLLLRQARNSTAHGPRRLRRALAGPASHPKKSAHR